MNAAHLGLLLACLAASTAAACDDDSGVGGAASGGQTAGGAAATGAGGAGGAFGAGGAGDGGHSAAFEAVQTQVFVGCGAKGDLMTCHSASPFGGDLDLRPGHAFSALVGQPATQSVGKTRVVPGDTAQSFLWQKLQNQLAPDASEGDPMPSGEAIMWQPLPQEQLDLVQAWIDGGAN